ncbi:response regulator [Elioraea tepida]|uniref:histidine kinase n=1 Tax=Elioraea tepida TaxID=2843330 RepID=A0A975U514_9PROT|nr:ATP-binding protein [Elioraea tepida]QXM25518.1 response regulator [Elioraea tepida]
MAPYPTERNKKGTSPLGGYVLLEDVSSSAHRLGQRTVALLLVATLVPILLAGAAIAYLRDAAVEDAKTRLLTVLEVAARHAESVLELNGEIARLLAEDLADPGSGRSVAERATDPGLAARLAAIADRHDAVASVMVTDAAGLVLMHSAGLPAGPVRLDGADGLARALAGEPGPLLVRPYSCPITGTMQLSVAVAIPGPAGPAGAVLVATPADYLSRFYASVRPFRDFLVTWVDVDGWQLAGREDATAGRRAMSDPSWIAQAIAPSADAATSLVQEGPGSSARLVLVQRLARWPIAVVVSADRKEVASGNDSLALVILGVLLVASGAVWWLARSLRKGALAHAALIESLGEADAARRQAEDRLHHAQKLESVGMLTGGVAHDFNNLLSVLLGCTEALALRFRDDPRARETTDLMLRTIERGSNLTGQLLSFARKQMLFPVACDVGRQVERCRTLLAKAAGEANELVLDLSPAALPVRVDPTHLDACLINLVSNARDGMQRQGRIVVRTRARAITPADATEDLPAGEYAVIDVEDNGCGMGPEVMARAFEPFFTTKEPGRGTGLGLSMVYGFATQSGGTARIESRMGRGTRVSVFLPLSAEQDHEPAPMPEETPEHITARILLVDDDATVRGVMAATLRDLGAQVVECGDARSARDHLATGGFDIMVTDVVMPGDMTGQELALWAKQQRRNLPVLMISGFVGGEMNPALTLMEDIAFLPKPITRSELARSIAGLLAAARQKAQG